MIEEEMRRREEGEPSGCFGVNTIVETSESADLAPIAAQVTANFQNRVLALAGYLSQGQREGSITSSMTAGALAEFVHGSVVGIRVAARVGSPP